jgi:hypothetical protein
MDVQGDKLKTFVLLLLFTFPPGVPSPGLNAEVGYRVTGLASYAECSALADGLIASTLEMVPGTTVDGQCVEATVPVQ